MIGEYSTQPTDRQFAILARVVEEGSVKGAARSLGIREQTAKNRLANLYRRLRLEEGSVVRAVWLLRKELECRGLLS